jgi:hypothetical protein
MAGGAQQEHLETKTSYKGTSNDGGCAEDAD